MSASDTSIQSVEMLLDEKPAAEGETPWRALEYFASTRVIVAAALVFASAAFGARPSAIGGMAGSTLAVSLSYFALAALFAGLALYVHRRFLAQVIGQLVLDLIVITLLVVSSGGVASGWVILFLLPLAGASLLLPSTLGFFRVRHCVLRSDRLRPCAR